MNKTPILAILVLLALTSTVYAYSFMNYGHNALWNETGDCAGNLCATWTGTPPTVEATQKTNGTNGIQLSNAFTFSNTGYSSTNFNFTYFIYVPNTTLGTGVVYLGLRDDTVQGCSGDGKGFSFGYTSGTSTTQWSYCTGGTWTASGISVTAGWHQVDINRQGTNYQFYFDGVSLKNGTDSKLGSYINGYSNIGSTYFDDLHAWNGTIDLTLPNYLTISAYDIITNNLVTGIIVNLTNSSGSITTYTNSTGTSITTNNTGIFNISISIGNGTYYHINYYNYNFSTTVSLNVYSYQALLNISATQAYTNNTITTFNVTNRGITNSSNNNFVLLPAILGNNNLRINVIGNITQNSTCNVTMALAINQCTITGIHDTDYTIGANFFGSGIPNFTVQASNTTLNINLNYTTTTGNITFPLLQGYYYFFNIQSTGYAYANKTLAANATSQTYNFSLQTSDIMNLTFYSEVNGSTIVGPNITLYLVSPSQSATYTTINGTIQTLVMSPDSYVLTYSATNYTTRSYQTILVSNSIVTLRLPMLLNSAATTVTITLTDKSGGLLDNATVKAYLYDISTNSYIVNQIGTSNSQGILTMSLQLNSWNYYFTVDYQGQTRLVTVPSQIYSNTLALSVPITTSAFSTVVNGLGITGSIINSTPYGQYRFTWVDNDNIATQGCLYAYQYAGLGRNPTLYGSNCTTTSSGTVYTQINNQSNLTYYLYGIVTKDDFDYTIDTKLITSNSAISEELQSPIWLFVMLLIMLVLASIFRKSPAVAVFIIGLIPVLFSATGLVAISLAYTTPLFVIALVVAVIIGQPWK